MNKATSLVMMLTLSKWVPEHISVRRILTCGIFFLCGGTAWLRGGLYSPLQWFMLTIALLLCGGMAFLRPERLQIFRFRLVRDPLFYLGLTFLILIIAQWINSNYWVVADEEGVVEMSRNPPRWLPWSVDREDSGQMFGWFFPAWVVVLLVRNLLNKSHVKLLLYLLVWNSALLACVGIGQQIVGMEKMMGFWHAPSDIFFATFDYPNHAAAWFYLNAALAAGLAHESAKKRKPPVQIAVWAVCFLMCIIASFMTLSRFGASIALIVLLVALVVFMRRALRNRKGSSAVNVYIAACIVALLGGTLFLGAGSGSLSKEVLSKALVGEKSVAGDLAGRIEQMPLAWEIVKDYPLFGSGGWGYRWLTKLYIPAEEWGFWEKASRANVHCDPLQFLSEFGFFGATCMGLIVAVLIAGAVAGARVGVLALWMGGGLAVVFLHSLIDLPFRCPAIVLQWCCLLSAVPLWTRKRVRPEEVGK